MPHLRSGLLTFLFPLITLAQSPLNPKAKPKPWLEMDYGPTLSASIESSLPERQITQKAIAIRLDPETQTYFLFDEDLLRYSVATTGGLIDFKGVLFDGTHRTWPTVAGDEIFGTRLTPGWADRSGSFTDPRPRFKSTDYKPQPAHWQNRPYGPLPREHAQYKGLYLHGQQAILSYTVGQTPILDSPGLERLGDQLIVTRTLNISLSQHDLTAELAEHPTQTGTLLSKSLALLGHPMTPGANLAATMIGDTTGVTFRIETGRLRLHIPATATPAKIKLLISRASPDALTTFAKSSPPPQDLSTLTHGGPPRYPQLLTTRGVTARSPPTSPFESDSLTAPTQNSWKSRLRFSGFDFFPDGRSAALCTWDGDVYLLTHIDDTLAKLTWQRIATGLFQPLGLKIVGSEIFVMCRDQLVGLHDLNGDNEIDFYECFNNDAQVTEHFHEFAMGLQTDADGNFYYAKSARHALDAVTPQHGTVLRISKDGQRTDILATGFRAANGIGIGPNGQLAATDQEGFWTPANRINFFTPLPGSAPFFGNIWSSTTKRTVNEGYDPPLCWIPVAVDRSPAEDLWIPANTWGPLAGRLLHTSYGTGRLYLIPYEMIDNTAQGAIVPLDLPPFPTGIMRARFNPVDHHLYTCGLVGWATNCTEPGAVYRVRYTGKPLNMPIDLHVRKNEIAITFSDALDKATAEDLDRYAIQQWNYRWTQNYGSKPYRVSDPKKEGQDDVDIESAKLSDDAKTILLSIPDLKPVMQMKIQLNLQSADGLPVKHTLHNTINRIP